MTDRPRILIVEDDAGIAGMMRKCIERDGSDVRTVSTGHEALPLIRSGDYAAILLDLLVPPPSGAEIIEDVRTSAPHILPRIIVVTASPVQLRSLDVRDLGGVVIKPFEIAVLGELVRSTARAQ